MLAMDPVPGITRSLERVKAWCVDTALPYWAEAGFDRAAKAFHERLDFTGAPILSPPRRTMVQGRQIYAFAHAARLGWLPTGAGLAVDAAESMIRRHWAPDGSPGWVFSVAGNGAVMDARRDIYTHAFAIYGLAWAYKLLPDPHFRDVAEQTFEFLGSYHPAARRSGSHNIDSRAGTRQQNPYMHLFEAALAWYEATGDGRYLERADELYALFAARFFQPGASIVVEHFDEDWRPAAGHRGEVFEPGHHFEWVWLLRRYAEHSGRDVGEHTDALFETAVRTAFVNGVVAAEVRGDPPAVFNGESRVWSHTEGIKAAAAEHEAGRESMIDLADRLSLILESRFLGKPIAAGWLDHFNADGSLKVDFVPASTLYHIVLGLAEADRVFGTSR